MKFILVLVICNATSQLHNSNGLRSLIVFMIVQEWDTKQPELRIADFGEEYVNKNRTAILFKCQEIAQT